MTEPLSFRQVGLASPQPLFLPFQTLGRGSPLHSRRQQSQPEDDKGDGSNSGGTECGDAYGVSQVRRNASGRKTRGGHAGVVHDGDRSTHYEGSSQLSPADPRFLISEVKGNPQCGERDQNREDDGK